MTTKINKSHLILLKIIDTHGNKNCADCGVEGTRWASWNLGIFLCIRCAGIHRNLGVHISKVKSVDLDSWTSEQLQVMEVMGNRKSQQIYEAALPETFTRPQSNYAMEEFIRAKYQYKRYCINEAKIETSSISVAETVTNKSNEASLKKLVLANNDENPTSIKPKTTTESDDSLSDPEYLIELKEKQKKPCHKVHSEGDLINFNCNKGQNNRNDLTKVDAKDNILSLYNHQPATNGGYQSSFTPSSMSSHHKSYGSSVDAQYHSTTSIPVSSQNSYLKQIQDKITVIKDNLTSKFRQYEQPNNSSYQSSNMSFQRNASASTQNNISQNGGQTLSPDLWR